MRALIVDDERPARAKLRRLLASHGDVEIVGEAEDGRAAVEAIRRLSPDVVFLDIQMPLLNGFDVIEAVGVEAMPPVVFVTAYDEHALRAFEVQALDYLLKPVAADRLRSVVTRLRQRRGPAAPADDLSRQLAAVLKAIDRPAFLRHLMVWKHQRAQLVAVDDIAWLEADRNNVAVHLAGATCTVRGTLTDLAARLDPDRFMRISRSHVVRLDAVKELQPWFHGDYRVLMKDGTELRWSRRYRRDFR